MGINEAVQAEIPESIPFLGNTYAGTIEFDDLAEFNLPELGDDAIDFAEEGFDAF